MIKRIINRHIKEMEKLRTDVGIKVRAQSNSKYISF